MGNYYNGIRQYNRGKYAVWTHELFMRPAYIIAVTEVKKGRLSLPKAVEGLARQLSPYLPAQKVDLCKEEIERIIERGKEWAD